MTFFVIFRYFFVLVGSRFFADPDPTKYLLGFTCELTSDNLGRNNADSNRQHWSNGTFLYRTLSCYCNDKYTREETLVRLGMIQVKSCCNCIPTLYVVGCTKSILRTVCCETSPNSDSLLWVEHITYLISWENIVKSTLLDLPPLRFRCVGGWWDRTKDRCDFGIDSQTL
jgi:hypothetical protein